MVVTVNFYAAVRSIVGTNYVEVEPGSLDSITSQLSATHPELKSALLTCSFLIDGAICHDSSTVLMSGSSLDILPAFAGG